MSLRVLLADDHAIVRQGLRYLLEREGFQVVAEASNGRDAISLNQIHQPEIALFDLSMPLLNGIDAAREVIKSSPHVKVVLLTMHTDDGLVLEALRAGIKGYVLKSRGCEEVVQAVRAVSQGEMYLTPSLSRAVIQAFLRKEDMPESPISDRERQVLQLVAEGKTTKEVAALLGISVKTAESHRSNIMDKLNIHDIAGLVRYAMNNHLING